MMAEAKQVVHNNTSQYWQYVPVVAVDCSAVKLAMIGSSATCRALCVAHSLPLGTVSCVLYLLAVLLLF